MNETKARKARSKIRTLISSPRRRHPSVKKLLTYEKK
jgi:hypothetical protein